MSLNKESFTKKIQTAGSPVSFFTVPYNQIYYLNKLTLTNASTAQAQATLTDEFTTEDGTAHTQTLTTMFVGASSTRQERELNSKPMLNDIKAEVDQTPVTISVSVKPK